MAGNTTSGKKAAATNKALYGADFYRVISRLGGLKSNPKKGFGTHRELARVAGRKGGSISKRPVGYKGDII